MQMQTNANRPVLAQCSAGYLLCNQGCACKWYDEVAKRPRGPENNDDDDDDDDDDNGDDNGDNSWCLQMIWLGGQEAKRQRGPEKLERVDD